MTRHRSGGHRAFDALMMIAVVAVALSLDAVPDAAAEDAAHTGAMEQAQAGHERGRPAAPQLLSVEIVPDGAAKDEDLRANTGAVPAAPVQPKDPLRANDGAAR